MTKVRSRVPPCVLLLGLLALPCGSLARGADARFYDVCAAVLHEEQIDRENAELELDLARSNVAAYRQIYELIEGLWAADAIDRMSYLKGKYDYEAAKLSLEQAELIVLRQKSLVEQYRLYCDAVRAAEGARDRSSAAERAGMAYRKADCEQRAKAVEVARTNLEFDRQFLASVRDLREGQVATRQDVILAELEVEREQKRLADAERRTEACRRELGLPVQGAPE